MPFCSYVVYWTQFHHSEAVFCELALHYVAEACICPRRHFWRHHTILIACGGDQLLDKQLLDNASLYDAVLVCYLCCHMRCMDDEVVVAVRLKAMQH